MTPIGQVVRVDSVLDWLVEVFREGDVRSPPGRRDFSVGTFLKVRAGESKLVSVVRDVVVHNPDYGTLRVKAGDREEIEELMPDLSDRVRTLILVYYLGTFERGEADYSYPDLVPRLHDEVVGMSDEEVKNFHIDEGSLSVGYLPRLLKLDNSPHLFSKMVDRIGDVLERDVGLLEKIRDDVSTRSKLEGMREGY